MPVQKKKFHVLAWKFFFIWECSPQAKIFWEFFLTEWPSIDLVIKANIRGSFSINLKTGLYGQNCKFYDLVNARRRRKILRIFAHRMTQQWFGNKGQYQRQFFYQCKKWASRAELLVLWLNKCSPQANFLRIFAHRMT